MSQLVVKVTTIDEIKVHPNADLLEILVVGGWQTVVPKGMMKEGEKVVYFPPDTVMPIELSERYGVTKYLGKGGRIVHNRLRGEPSFGLVRPPDDPEWPIGLDVAEYYGVTKYEPPFRPNEEDVETPHPAFLRYTEIENLRHFPHVFEEGEYIAATEKIHGANTRVGIIDGVYMVGSHSLRRKLPLDSDGNVDFERAANGKYTYPISLPEVRNLLETLAKDHNQVILYGEVYGPKIQSFAYGEKKLGYRAFDLMVDGNYIPWRDFREMMEQYEVDDVPPIYFGPYSLDKIKEISEGKTIIRDGENIREGVVVRPFFIERTHPEVGRVILKYLSDSYLLGKHTDFTEV